MKKVIVIIYGFIFTFIFTGNFIEQENNSKKSDESEEYYSKVIKKPTEYIWNALIKLTTKTSFFEVDTSKKETGLLKLRIVPVNFSEFVTAGQINITMDDSSTFSGDLIDYMKKYLEAKLVADMDITISKISKNKTKLVINTQYSMIYFSKDQPIGSLVFFGAGGCANLKIIIEKLNNSEPWKVCPTHKAENEIIKFIEKLK